MLPYTLEREVDFAVKNAKAMHSKPKRKNNTLTPMLSANAPAKINEKGIAKSFALDVMEKTRPIYSSLILI